MTTTSDIETLLVAALVDKTAAQHRVFSPRDIPTKPSGMPVLLVQTPKERKENAAGRNGPASFNTTALFRVAGQINGPASAGDAGALAIEAALGVLQRQIEVAVINDESLRSAIMQYVSVDIDTTVRRDGEYHIGEVAMIFALEFYQQSEDFAPQVYQDLDVMQVFIDLANVFDPNGDYTAGVEAQLFPGAAQPSPRSVGPDGRTEGLIVVGIDGDPTSLEFDDPDNSQNIPAL